MDNNSSRITVGSTVRVLNNGDMLFTGTQWKVTELDRLGYTVTVQSPVTGNKLTVVRSRVQKLDV
jgi:hypothetical protein